MNKEVKISELYDCKVKYLESLFVGYEFPWELLLQIKGCIYELFNAKIEGYRFLKENVMIGENVIIHSTATIEGPAFIGSGSEVRAGAFIRGSVITGEGCVIGNSTEIKNSILLDRVQIPHYNYVGDSILGNSAHMGAGAICSNLKSDGTSVVIHADKDYHTGLRKVGAFLGDGADIGCGCVLNPGTVVGKNTSVYPLTALRGVYEKNLIVKSAELAVPKK